MSRSLGVALLFFFLNGCAERKEVAVSFYYWRTVFKLSEAEREAIKVNHVSKMYVRYFDVTLENGSPVPLSPIVFQMQPDGLTIVPVVYIKNEVFLHRSVKLDDLAAKVNEFIGQVNTRNNIHYAEVQIDCDWTLKSKENYLKFVQLFKQKSGKKLSATVRLHQIKYYRGTGIPDVDRGVLMYYNMGHIGADSSNSIYERDIAQRYLGSLKGYPLALDIALPIYSWGIHSRDGKVVRLINKVRTHGFSNDRNFEPGEKSFFEVKGNVIKMGRYFKKGDRIKIESISANDLQEMADDIKDNIRLAPNEIIFYDLDDSNLKHYTNDKQFFQKISSLF